VPHVVGYYTGNAMVAERRKHRYLNDDGAAWKIETKLRLTEGIRHTENRP